MIGELEDYIKQKNWKVRPMQGGTQLRLEDPCPFCGHEKKVFFNPDNGLWKCFHAECLESSGGNILTMRRKLGDLEARVMPAHMVYLGSKDKVDPSALRGRRPVAGLDDRCHERLMEQKDALLYLNDVRGFSNETVEKFNLGFVEKKGKRLLSTPFYADGELVNIKFRTLPPDEKAFRRVTGCPSTLFNQDVLKDIDQLDAEDRIAFVLESETDCMAMVQFGFDRSVASSVGASSWSETWLRPLEDATEIYLVYDNDEAGEAGAAKAADMLGRYRCKRVLPALHDIAEMLAAGMETQDVQDCIDSARPYEDGTLKPTSAFGAALMSKLSSPQPRGRPTGSPALDIIWGGVRDSELTVVTGDTGSGKSTWTTWFAYQRLLADESVMVAPFEMRPDEVLGKLVSMRAGQSVFDMQLPDVDHQIKKISSYPLYWLDCYGSLPLDKLKDAIYLAVRRYGVRFIVIDHLHYFLQIASPSEERFRIEEAIRALKSWSVDLRTHIMVVIHPHQLGYDNQGKIRKPDLNNLKGASALKQEADNGIRVHRHRTENRTGRPEATVTVLKCRSPAGGEGSIPYRFDTDSETYHEKAPPNQMGSRQSAAAGDDTYEEEDDWDTPV